MFGNYSVLLRQFGILLRCFSQSVLWWITLDVCDSHICNTLLHQMPENFRSSGSSGSSSSRSQGVQIGWTLYWESIYDAPRCLKWFQDKFKASFSSYRNPYPDTQSNKFPGSYEHDYFLSCFDPIELHLWLGITFRKRTATKADGNSLEVVPKVSPRRLYWQNSVCSINTILFQDQKPFP